MDHPSSSSDVIIRREPPSDYASTTYAVSIIAVAALVVGIAFSGALNTGSSGGEKTAAEGAPPAVSAEAPKESPPAGTESAGDAATAPAAEKAAEAPAQPDAEPAATTGASTGEAGTAAPAVEQAAPDVNKDGGSSAPVEQTPENAPAAQ
jgi:hypothetical protein